MTWRVLVSAPYMLPVLDDFRSILAEHDIVPVVAQVNEPAPHPATLKDGIHPDPPLPPLSVKKRGKSVPPFFVLFPICFRIDFWTHFGRFWVHFGVHFSSIVHPFCIPFSDLFFAELLIELFSKACKFSEPWIFKNLCFSQMGTRF